MNAVFTNIGAHICIRLHKFVKTLKKILQGVRQRASVAEDYGDEEFMDGRREEFMDGLREEYMEGRREISATSSMDAGPMPPSPSRGGSFRDAFDEGWGQNDPRAGGCVLCSVCSMAAGDRILPAVYAYCVCLLCMSTLLAYCACLFCACLL